MSGVEDLLGIPEEQGSEHHGLSRGGLAVLPRRLEPHLERRPLPLSVDRARHIQNVLLPRIQRQPGQLPEDDRVLSERVHRPRRPVLDARELRTDSHASASASPSTSPDASATTLRRSVRAARSRFASASCSFSDGPCADEF